MSRLIFGGTFDPIHLGHLHIAIAAQKAFSFDRVLFVPCHIPALKDHPAASKDDRLNMLSIALAPYPQFEVDTREILRDGPSYTVTTLLAYREELGKNYPLTFLMGVDAFNLLAQWYQWERILTLAHILLVNRADEVLSTDAQQFLSQHETLDKSRLLNESGGCIYSMNAGHFPYSSTSIRSMLSRGEYEGLPVPMPVLDYIKTHNLY